MSESFCVENISYIYYSGENGSIPNGPKCHSCMNEAFHSGGLKDIDQISIFTKSGLLSFSIRCLTFLNGTASPFSFKYIAEIPIATNCVQCCIKRSSELHSNENQAYVASADRGLEEQEVSDIVGGNYSATEEACRTASAVRFPDLARVGQNDVLESSQDNATTPKSNEVKRKQPSSGDGYVTKRVKTECDEIISVHSTDVHSIDGERNPGSSHAEASHMAMESNIPEVSHDDEPTGEFLNSNSHNYDDRQSSAITAHNIDRSDRPNETLLDNISYLLDSIDQISKGSIIRQFLEFKIHKQFGNPRESRKFISKVVDLVYEKALQHPEHSKFYVHLCKKQVNIEFNDLKKSDFDYLLQAHVQRTLKMTKSKTHAQGTGNTDDALKIDSIELQNRNLAHVIFIGNMLNRGLLTEKIIDWCVSKLIEPEFAVIPETPYKEDRFILVARMLFEVQEGKISDAYRSKLYHYLKNAALKCSDKARSIILMCIGDTMESLKRNVAERTKLERELYILQNIV